MQAQLPSAPPTSEQFRDVIGRFATGVTVVTTRSQGTALGTTASAVCSVSLDPPTLLICMNRTSATGAAIRACGLFAVNVLGERQGALARRFAAKGEDKFDDAAHVLGALGMPLLDAALAHVECRVVEQLAGGTHHVLLGRVEAVAAADGPPLTYFRGRFGRFQHAEEL